jgi:hypothetical protein
MFLLERLPCFWVRAVLFYRLTYDLDIKYRALCRADWMFEGLQTCGAEIER